MEVDVVDGDDDEVDEGLGTVILWSIEIRISEFDTHTRLRPRPAMVNRPRKLYMLGTGKVIKKYDIYM